MADKKGRTPEEKLCDVCSRREDIEHVLRDCQKFEDLREINNIEELDMNKLLGIQDWQVYEGYRIQVYQRIMGAE